MTNAERGILLAILAFASFAAVVGGFNNSNIHQLRGSPREWTETVRCVRVIDGDTIEIEGGVIVRLVGIEAFEIRRGERLDREAEAAGISVEEALARGREQAEELRRRIEGKDVILRYRLYPTDRYGRRLGELRESE